MRIKELAATRVMWGYRRLHVLLSREGWAANAKKVYRLYREEGLARLRRKPRTISVDNGPEFASRALDAWAYRNGVTVDFSRPGKPTDNAFAEAFNSVLRRECLSQHYLIDLEDAQRVLDRWRADYNNFRPHGSLARSTPAEYAAGALFTHDPEKLENLHF
jgi:transposase InsO family protein